MLRAIPFIKTIYHHRAGRHIDTQRQGFSGKNAGDQPLLEGQFHCLLDDWQHPGMMGSKTCLGSGAKGRVPQNIEVSGRNGMGGGIKKIPNIPSLIPGGQPQPSPQTLFNRLLTSCP